MATTYANPPQDTTPLDTIDHTIIPIGGNNLNPTLFAQVGTDATLWNKAFPYRFQILEQDPIKGLMNTGRYFDLPIPPEALEINTPFAINTSVTLNGIIEQHNAFPLLNIFLRGSTGVLNKLNVRTGSNQLPAKGILAGTINAVNAFAKDIKSLNAQPGPNTAIYSPSLIGNTDFSGSGQSLSDAVTGAVNASLAGTGYSRFLALRNFLESYAILKKQQAYQGYRLAFTTYKDQYSYICTPKMFRMVRSAESPFEFKYEIQLESWQRIKADQIKPNFSGQHRASQANNSTWQNILKYVQLGLTLLNDLSGIISGVISDVQGILNVVREISLFLKNLVGVALQAADMPAVIVNNLKNAILASINNIATATAGSNGQFPSSQQVQADYQACLRWWTTQQMVNPIVINGPVNNMLRTNVDYIFENPSQHYGFFNSIALNSLNNMTSAIQAQINTEIQNVSAYSVVDFKNAVATLQNASNVYAQAVGASDPTYIETYQLGSVNQIRDTPTDDDYAVLNTINDMIIQTNNIIAALQSNTNITTPQAVTFVANLANQAGIPFDIPLSKYPIPFPYGGTLEMIAQNYLGDPDKWIEIATLNGLRSPYVDEIGFLLDLTTNGNNDTITVADVSNLILGQTVWIGSNTVPVQSRSILAINNLSPDSWSVTLDGPDDLGILKTSDNAYLHAFLPFTVNSQGFVAIPSQNPPVGASDPVSRNDQISVAQQIFDAAGTDLLIDSDNDLIITQNGDCRLSQGVQNIIQTLKILIELPRGSLLHHPTIGVNLVGGSLADLSATDIASTIKTAIDQDGFFSNWTYSVTVKVDSNWANVTINLNVSNVQQLLPITFKLNIN